MIIYTIREHAGALYAVHGATLWFEPGVHLEHWWKLDRQPGDLPEGASATYDNTLGVYRVKTPDWPGRHEQLARRARDSGENADRTIETEIPKPKTKRQVRWHEGVWQQLYARGWR